MKRRLYDLTDEPFVVFVNKIGEVLRNENIPHNIVGGVATQAYILDMLTKKYEKNISEIAYDTKIRVQDYIRSTDDVDVALDLRGEDTEKIKKINKFLPKLIFEDISPSEESIIEFKSERVGASRPVFKVYVDEKGNQDTIIAMNISRNQKGDLYNLDDVWYEEFLNQTKLVSLPYLDNFNLTLNVPRLEHLLASKISKCRAKDLMDNKNLMILMKDKKIGLDFEEMEKILLPLHEDNYEKFLSLEYPSRLSN